MLNPGVIEMFGFLNIALFFFGIGAIIGLIYVFIRYVIPLILFTFLSIIKVFRLWGNAFMKGWRGGR